MVDDDDNDVEMIGQNAQEKKKSKKQMKREAKNDKDIKKHKDYELFLQDIEDDPEFRANVNLYRNDDIIGQLEAQIGKMTLDDAKQSNIKSDIEKGVSKVGNEERLVKKAVRKTAIGKAI